MMHVAHLIAHSYIGMGSHNALYPPLVVPAIAPHVSMDTLLGLTINAKYTTTVIGPFGFQFIQQGNDSGFVVPHIAIPPPSVLVPVVIAFGGSKPMFAASTVKMQGKPVSAGMIPYNFVSINQACNDPCNYPSDMVICPNSVLVGLTLGDFLGGLISIAVDCAISAIANKIGGAVAEGIMSKIAARLAAPFLRAFTNQMTEAFGREMAETMTREAAQNIMERPLALAIQETIGKITENIFGGLVDYDLTGLGAPQSGDLGTSAGRAIDAPSGTAATTNANSQNHPGAAPIHSAE
ncbi:MAG: hypothetical protein WBS20_11675 [Lysobacterales bacterium]